MSSIEYLDEERRKLWETVTELEKELKKRTPEAENEAKQHSKKASEYRNKADDSQKSALKSAADAEAMLASITISHELVENIKNELLALKEVATEKATAIDSNYSELLKKQEQIEKQIGQLSEIFEYEDTIADRVQKLEDADLKAADFLTKISATHTNVFERKKEIDQVYYTVIGYPETDDNGEIKTMPGLKDELSNAYKDTKAKLEDLYKETEEFTMNNEQSYSAFTVGKETDYNTRIVNWEKEYKAISDKIKTLLPYALTAGLSSAYSKKKEDEVKESESYSIAFYRAVGGLMVVSLLPLAVSVYEIINNTPLHLVLLGLPNLAMAILPLYIPVLWLAYSANKKRNLSKRLIEEYTHKEVLSKTYEGLSTQINQIEDKTVSAELRNKLLFNILEISAENPGKLISDYQKSDHPLMEALEKSVQLGTAVDKLQKIPGFAWLANRMEKKSKQIIQQQNKFADKGFEHMAEKDSTQQPEENA